MTTPPQPSETQRLAAYAVIGAVIGSIVIWFVTDAFSIQAIGSGLLGGAVAGVAAGWLRSWAGLDR